jgi:hypothetical protein
LEIICDQKSEKEVEGTEYEVTLLLSEYKQGQTANQRGLYNSTMYMKILILMKLTCCDRKKRQVKKIAVFINLVMITGNISPNKYVTRTIYFSKTNLFY